MEEDKQQNKPGLHIKAGGLNMLKANDLTHWDLKIWFIHFETNLL